MASQGRLKIPREGPDVPPNELFNFFRRSPIMPFQRGGSSPRAARRIPFGYSRLEPLAPYLGHYPPLTATNLIRDIDEAGESGATRPSLRIKTAWTSKEWLQLV